MNKPQSVINWLNEYKELNDKLKEHRTKRAKMIVIAHDKGMTVTTIANLFDMQQQNVSHILKNQEKYLAGLSAPRDEETKRTQLETNGRL